MEIKRYKSQIRIRIVRRLTFCDVYLASGDSTLGNTVEGEIVDGGQCVQYQLLTALQALVI